MKMLFVAPFSPPYNGNSLPVKFMYDELSAKHHIEVVNVVKKGAPNGFTFRKVFQTLGIIKEIWKRRKNRDMVYLTLAESFVGNVRDFVIYAIFRNKLDRMVVHMLGGAGMKLAIEKGSGLRFWLNRYFLSRVGGVIVEGKPQADFFSKVVDREKIHVVPNYAEDYLFTTEEAVKAKFANTNPLRILFLSNLLYGKGHMELVSAFKRLPIEDRQRLVLEIAGGFESEKDKTAFHEFISDTPEIVFHGHVVGDRKKALYHQSHVFCLPTYYPWEGQPFCILEAYASGCVVVTTDHSGISQVFQDRNNGVLVEKQSVDALVQTLQQLIRDREKLAVIGLYNLNDARNNYTATTYKQSMFRAFSKTLGIDPTEMLC